MTTENTLIIELGPEAREAMEKVMAARGMTRAEAVTTALGDAAFFDTLKKDGWKIYARQGWWFWKVRWPKLRRGPICNGVACPEAAHCTGDPCNCLCGW